MENEPVTLYSTWKDVPVTTTTTTTTINSHSTKQVAG